MLAVRSFSLLTQSIIKSSPKGWIPTLQSSRLANMFPSLHLPRRTRNYLVISIVSITLSAVLLILVRYQEEKNRTEKLYRNYRKISILRDVRDYYENPHNTFLNQHQYTFSISSAVCSKRAFYVVFVVHSKPSNYQQRALIRMTYGSVKQYQGKSLTLVFMIGAVHDKVIQDTLLHEAAAFDDIVQGNFIDSYTNLSMKHIMAMHWFNTNCKADFVFKVDDDTFVNPYRLVEYLILIPKSGMKIYCKLALDTDTPDRDRKSPTYTPYDLYPFDVFPDFCLGFAYITTPNVWRVLYNSSTYYRALPVDDVYVTGILASLSGIERKDIGYVMYDCLKYLNKFNRYMFNESVVVLDRNNDCINEPFHHWLDIEKKQLS